jgi:hypothetical protein
LNADALRRDLLPGFFYADGVGSLGWTMCAMLYQHRNAEFWHKCI